MLGQSDMMGSNKLFGQWIGQISGTNFGYLILNVDLDRPNLASVHVDDPQQPFSAMVDIMVKDKTVEGTLTGFFPHGQLDKKVHLPQVAKFSGNLQDNHLNGTWGTDVKTEGQFELERYEAFIKNPPDHVMKWGDFRNWALDECHKKKPLIFRGQDSSEGPLVTFFHRTGRRNLLR